MSASWPDLAGRLIQIEGAPAHVMAIRVYFEDTDAGGVAYHASYVRWCERGRSDFLRLLGTDARRMIDGSDNLAPAAFVVRRMTFDFARPAFMDDVLEVTTRVRDLGGASLTLTQTITRTPPAASVETHAPTHSPKASEPRQTPTVSQPQRLCEADVTVVLVSVSGKPLRLPEDMRAKLAVPTQ